MSILKPLGTSPAYLRAGFLGFPKSGKTYTATTLAIGTRALFKLDGPIAFFDTEGGTDYIGERVRKETGKDLVGVKSRSFTDLMQAARECEKSGVSVFLVDSVTHVWRELCDAMLMQINDRRKKRGWNAQRSLEFQDWSTVKGKWAEWTDFFLNSRLHVIICGRSGFTYDMVANEEGKKELTKTGTKMKVETEFGFEPSLLVEMEQIVDDSKKRKVVHRATVIGDRFGLIDAKQCDDPSFKFFEPHVRALDPSGHSTIDTTVKTDLKLGEEGDGGWHREKRQRTIFAEEIQGELARAYPGQTAAEKAAKADLLEKFFLTRSWTKVSEQLDSETLSAGLHNLRLELGTVKQFADQFAAPADDDLPEGWGASTQPGVGPTVLAAEKTE